MIASNQRDWKINVEVAEKAKNVFPMKSEKKGKSHRCSMNW